MKPFVLVCALVVSAGAFAIGDEATRDDAMGRGASVSVGGYHAVWLDPFGEIHIFGDDSHHQRDGFPSGRKFKAVSAGYFHTCGILEDDTITCFGKEEGYAMAFPVGEKFRTISAGGFISCGIRLDGNTRCFGGYSSDADSWPRGKGFVSISAGVQSAVALAEDGHFYYGGNQYFSDRYRAISYGYYACAIRENQSLWCAEDVEIPSDLKFRSLATSHSAVVCGLLLDGTARCFGENLSSMRFPESAKFETLSAGNDHICGIMEDGNLSCFGRTDGNQMKGLPTGAEFGSFLVFYSFENGLSRMTPFFYPEVSGFLEDIATAVARVPFNQHSYSERLLAYNLLGPFIEDLQTEFSEAAILPRYQIQRQLWNKRAGISDTSQIAFSGKAFEICLDFLIAAVKACVPFAGDEKAQKEISELLAALGEIKASGARDPGGVVALFEKHASLLVSLRETASGFVAVIDEVRGYLATQEGVKW